jgi:AraC-like DNA-binding protein
MSRIVREITPISNDDFFVIFNHINAKFDFPIHYHPEYELNLVINSKGKRIIGDSIENYENTDLVLIGPNTPHAWTGIMDNSNAQVITIQFHSNFLSDKSLSRNIALPLKDVLSKSRRGVLFSQETTKKMVDKIEKLSNIQGFDSLLEFLSILYDLSISRNQKMLASASYVGHIDPSKSRRIRKVTDYINDNFHNEIRIKEVAKEANMSETAFSHFFKKQTQRSFTEYLIDVRIGYAAKLIIDSEKNINEICYESGFNNISNFNRTFKNKRGITPSEFRSLQKLITKH